MYTPVTLNATFFLFILDAEKGCHFLHILNCVQQDFGSCINEAILQRVINALEQNSDIVSTMEKYYTAFWYYTANTNWSNLSGQKMDSCMGAVEEIVTKVISRGTPAESLALCQATL